MTTELGTEARLTPILRSDRGFSTPLMLRVNWYKSNTAYQMTSAGNRCGFKEHYPASRVSH